MEIHECLTQKEEVYFNKSQHRKRHQSAGPFFFVLLITLY